MKKKQKFFVAPDGTTWRLEVRAPSASNAMVVFHHPQGGTSRYNRYAWHQSNGPGARDVTSRLITSQVLESLTDDVVALLFRRSMPISTPVPGPNLAAG